MFSPFFSPALLFFFFACVSFDFLLVFFEGSLHSGWSSVTLAFRSVAATLKGRKKKSRWCHNRGVGGFCAGFST